MKRILVPCDGSESALRAVRHAVAVARPAAAELQLIHVIEPMTPIALSEAFSAARLDERFPPQAAQALQPAIAILDQAVRRGHAIASSATSPCEPIVRPRYRFRGAATLPSRPVDPLQRRSAICAPAPRSFPIRTTSLARCGRAPAAHWTDDCTLISPAVSPHSHTAPANPAPPRTHAGLSAPSTVRAAVRVRPAPGRRRRR